MQIEETKSGSGARERLLEAAIDIFGIHGYESATTRMIAGDAGVNIAAIPYYFGGKEGLYLAVIEHIVAMIQERSDGMVEAIAKKDFAEDKEHHDARELLDELLIRFINFIVGSPQGQRIARIILREQMYPSSAYELIFSGFMEPVLGAIANLVKAITGEQSERRAKMRALAIMGQVLAFRIARETIVRSLELHGYDEDELQEIREIILMHTRGVLGISS